MKITVTAEHIKKGVPQSNCGCPIARAIRDLYADRDMIISVESKHVIFGEFGVDQTCYILDEMARKFIQDFDEGRTVKPGIFEILEDRDNGYSYK